MKTVCLSSSLRYEETAREVIRKLSNLGIKALFPNLDPGLNKDNLDKKRRLFLDHCLAIDRSEALYVINPAGYVGKSVIVEIGYALGRGKPIYFSEKSGSVDIDCLSSGIITLNSLERFLEL